MIELTRMQPGTRPFRNVVCVDFVVGERNTLFEPHDAGLLEATRLTSFATLSSA